VAVLAGGNTDALPPMIVFATDTTTTDAVTGGPIIVTPGNGVVSVDYGVPVTNYHLSPATATAAAAGGNRSRIPFARAWDEKSGNVTLSITAEQVREEGDAACSMELVEQAVRVVTHALYDVTCSLLVQLLAHYFDGSLTADPIFAC